MILKFCRILLLIIPFIFLSGFMPAISFVGPGITFLSSGNLVKAGAQVMIDKTIKEKTGKNSLALVKEEMTKQNNKKNLNKELRQLVEKRIKVVRKKIILQNKNKDLIQLVEKRIKVVRKTLDLKKINQ